MKRSLLDRTVSHGTFQPRHLVPAFADLLTELGSPAPPMDFTDEAVDELICQLDRLAPKGYYFGSHPGDGSDFGFWRYDDEDH